MSQHGRVSSRWPAEELNKVGDELIDLLGGNIPMEAEYKAGKEVQIQLTKAVALENNRGSITTAQKAGRKTKTTRPEPGSESGLETEPVDVQDSKAEGIGRGSSGSGHRTKEAPEQEVNYSVFSTVSAGTAGISLKICVGIRHLFT